ncbi:F-box/kelch-repeat protein At3g06240-like [Olea europaea var. sylvestris]|uniref:F-box/kelch-repeat protein At3g06240-like n=1 Tax=Olea europaea var. sylvestris TaxID=158386 RepID=UPI000C1CDC38|nr:F-box/kelch-repeat protein At3g06240-like [Olea europaea var. sylvestris]
MAANLPWDITIEILSRLPVKSLLRFNCVSKSFYSLISQDSHFKRKHLDHQSANHNLILNLEHAPECLFSCSLSSLSSDDQEDVVVLDNPIKVESWDCLRIARSCNGLLCIQDIAGIVCIWNPSTRELKRLPDCPRANDRIACSLGYDSSSDDYKVLSIHESLIGDRVARTELQLCSLKRDSSWRKIQDLPGMKFSWYDSYDFLNGAFYWIENVGSYSDLNGPLVIASFDIKKEIFKEFELFPPTRYSYQYTVFDVSVLGGKLCLYSLGSDVSFDLWEIEEYAYVHLD